MARASISLPVPLSPVIRTLTLACAIFRASCIMLAHVAGNDRRVAFDRQLVDRPEGGALLAFGAGAHQLFDRLSENLDRRDSGHRIGVLFPAQRQSDGVFFVAADAQEPLGGTSGGRGGGVAGRAALDGRTVYTAGGGKHLVELVGGDARTAGVGDGAGDGLDRGTSGELGGGGRGVNLRLCGWRGVARVGPLVVKHATGGDAADCGAESGSASSVRVRSDHIALANECACERLLRLSKQLRGISN